MRKRIVAFLMALLLFLFSESFVSACDKIQSDTYVSQILFGDSASIKESDENVKMLLNALYLCCMQSDGQGQKEIDYLKKKDVHGIPKLSDLDIEADRLLECSHNSWEYKEISPALKKQQENRKKVLRNTVNKIFGFGLLDNWFGTKKEKYDSFAALLYYSHILSDYLADQPNETNTFVNGEEVPSYSGEASVMLSGGNPSFTKAQKTSIEPIVKFSQLDSQGRAEAVLTNIDADILEKVDARQEMTEIRPSGWNQNKYEGLVASRPPYLFNRCHLLAHQLGGVEQEYNLITGTRYLNEAMAYYENLIAKYINDTGNHVVYRVTPIFIRDNKLASGVQLEAYSVEDVGQEICFNVYCYNVQPGVAINYMNGANERSDNIFGQKQALPFAVNQPDKSNSDLIYEMMKHLESLFANSKSKDLYMEMIAKINAIAKDARTLAIQENDAKYYMALKKFEYNYLDVLKYYVPRLLEKEEFFEDIF